MSGELSYVLASGGMKFKNGIVGVAAQEERGSRSIGALILLGYACIRLERGFLSPSLFGAAEVLWLFVVGVWPFVYGVVYL